MTFRAERIVTKTAQRESIRRYSLRYVMVESTRVQYFASEMRMLSIIIDANASTIIIRMALLPSSLEVTPAAADMSASSLPRTESERIKMPARQPTEPMT